MSVKPESVQPGDTSITGVDGARGVLTYRGFRIEDVVRHLDYESTIALLLWGSRPGDPGARDVRAELRARRPLPPSMARVLDALPAESSIIDGLRTAVSAMDDLSGVFPPTVDESLTLIARFPVLVARLFHRANGTSCPTADSSLGHVANYLWMLHGTSPAPERVRALERYFVLLADHGISASTFVLRIVLSTRSDLASASAAALGALKGPLHGGAPPEVLEMLDAAGSTSQTAAWIERTLAAGERLYGFGHPTYKVEDPRATLLRQFAEEVATPDRYVRARRFETVALDRLARARPGHPLYTNVDYYGALLLEGVGLPRGLFTPTFAAARTAGWGAHALEQVAQNRLVRPPEHYIGPAPRPWGLSARRRSPRRDA